MKLLLLPFLAVAAYGGQAFLEDGKEYVYDAELYQNAGTMDYSPSAAATAWKYTIRMQVAGDDINFRVTDATGSQYVGPWSSSGWAWDQTTFTAIPAGDEFSITYKNGQAVSLKVPSSYDTHRRNLVKAFATTWQIKLEDKDYFVAQENLLHGDCKVQYTVNNNMISKSVSHLRDCKHRKYRIVDNFRGYRCDGDWSMEAWDMYGKEMEGRNDPEPIYSSANTLFVVEKKGDRFQVNKMVLSGTVAAQYFESTGASSFIHVNRSLTLVDIRNSDGSIQPSGTVTLDDLSYEMSDGDYKWNKDRNLKEKEPFFSSGEYFKEDQVTLQGAIVKILDMIWESFTLHDVNQPNMDKLHKFGAGSAMPILYAMNYDSLMDVFTQLKGDTSEAGVAKQNMFREFVAEAGTSAAAIFIKDAVLSNLFDSNSDAARAVTGLAFHIRRPNVQLVNEFAAILESDRHGLVEMAGPLALAHLIQRTCNLAGNAMSDERRQCVRELSDVWAEKYFQKFTETEDQQEKLMAISFLTNLKSVKAKELLKPVAYGEYPGVDDQIQAKAVRAAFWGTVYTQSTIDFYLPIFMNMQNSHGARIAAIDQMFIMNSVDVTTLSAIMTQMFAEQDNEVLNYVFTLFDKYANSKYGCNEGIKADKVRYFLKYMKQMGLHKTDYGFGISKTYRQSFVQEKYGYGGGYELWVLGSHASTTPLEVGLRLDSNLFGGYQSNLLTVNIRIEGLAKTLIRKFLKKMPENEWRIQDLQNVFSSMGVALKPNQPIKVEFQILLKDVVVLHKMFDETAAEKGGELKEFISSLQGSGNQYSLNYQRALQWGSAIYEQPTESGLPMAYASALTTLASLEATVKRGLSRGVIFRDIDYDIHLNTQATTLMTFFVPNKRISYAIVQDRVYTAHFPRHIIIGVNIVKKELRLQILRPTIDHPFLLVMHSRTSVMARGANIGGEVDLSANCPSCPSKMVISNGQDAMKSRSVIDHTSKHLGSQTKAEIFDCEMVEIEEAKTVGHTVNAFLPFNKTPKTPFNIFLMGIRQVQAFFLYFPRTEQCGAYFRFSQSPENPVTEIDISIQGKMLDNARDTKLGQVGKKTFMKVEVVAKGEKESEKREFKLNLKYERGVGGLKNSVKVQFGASGNQIIGLPDYVICASVENTYSQFGKSYMNTNLDERLAVTGSGGIKYGEGTKCGAAQGSTDFKFEHSTTQLGREELKDKWFYKKCMEQRASSEWKSGEDPYTAECWMTLWDASLARKYSWALDFEKTTPYVQGLLSKAQTVVKAGLIPYWDVDPDALVGAITDTPKISFEFVFKNKDRVVDATFITDRGTSKFPDVNLNLPNWTGRLRQLKLETTIPQMIQSNILSNCMHTSESIHTLDNVTAPYRPSSCWTLISGHCAPTPGFAVFTKRNGKMPLSMRVYIGGHKFEFEPTDSKNIKVTKDGVPEQVADKGSKTFMEGKEEITKLIKWGSVYSLHSEGNVMVTFDGTFAQVIPAPYVKGQHCGVCGNFDGNTKNEFLNKVGSPVEVGRIAQAWCI
eukprot:TRINITY_DN2561_c0_g1_i1.p1 TRINITY_DN2561_c0_g1~~TRINITY_DN2561_c0_g1_i1.p1  ORF type:complete len:1526 (-),score=363.79 TRINITY_DN2561_c0_g1_i1:68-4645(-)